MNKFLDSSWAVVTVLLLALTLRGINLNQSLWLDEASQVIMSQQPIEQIVFERAGDFHPPLSYLLLHYWLILGTTEIWLRLLSVLLGVLTVWGVYLIAKEIGSKRFALFASLLFALAPYHIYYSQEIRMYSLAACWAVFSTFILLKFIQRSRYYYGLAYTVLTVLLLYTFYPAIFLILGHLAYLVFKNRMVLSKIWPYLLGMVGLYAPWLPYLGMQLQTGLKADEYLPGWSSLLSLSLIKSVPLTFFKFSFGRIDFENQIVYLIVALIVITIFGIGIIRGIVKAKSQEALILFWLLVPLLFTTLVSMKVPLFQPFRLIYILPAFYILLAIGIWSAGRLRTILAGLVVILSLTGIFLYLTQPQYWREDWRGVTSYINSNLDDSSVVVFSWYQPFDPYIWYRGKQGVGIVKKYPATWEEINQNMELLNTSNEIILVEYLQDLSDPDRLIQEWVKQKGFVLKKENQFKGVGSVKVYQR